MSKQTNSNRPKWKHIGRKTNWIYPIHTDKNTIKYIEEAQSVIIVESIGDLLNLKENGHHNVLVSFGLDISSKLSTFLVSLPIKNIILSLNNDFSSSENRGMNACFKNFLKLTSFFAPESLKICLPNKSDFGDMNTEDFNEWSTKLDKCIKGDQIEKIKNACEKMRSEGKLSQTLSKKIKFIK